MAWPTSLAQSWPYQNGWHDITFSIMSWPTSLYQPKWLTQHNILTSFLLLWGKQNQRMWWFRSFCHFSYYCQMTQYNCCGIVALVALAGWEVICVSFSCLSFLFLMLQLLCFCWLLFAGVVETTISDRVSGWEGAEILSCTLVASLNILRCWIFIRHHNSDFITTGFEELRICIACFCSSDSQITTMTIMRPI